MTKKNNNPPLILANWKMHKTISQAEVWLDAFVRHDLSDVDIVIAPPYTLLDFIKNKLCNTQFSIAGQNCSAFADNEGAFTGDISANMLKSIGCEYVIVGHSERRKYYHEDNREIKNKIIHAHQAQLTVILCVGEDLAIRESGNYKEQVWQDLLACLPLSANINNTIIAYEPIWAIGTGKTASIEQIEEMHKFLSNQIQNLFKTSTQIFEQIPKIIYGGSVNEDNATKILSASYVSGLLVGGASLDPGKFYQICKSISKIEGTICN